MSLSTTQLSFDENVTRDDQVVAIQNMYLRLCQIESKLIQVKIWILQVIILILAFLLIISLIFNFRK